MGEAKRRKLAGNYPKAASDLITFANKVRKLPRSPSMSPVATTPPLPLSDHILAFARLLSPEPPVLLPYTDVGAGYVARSCHLNSAHRVKHHGGERVFGWMIWTSRNFTEAEFHAVWRSTDGNLMDITPRVDGEEHVLFVPDPVTKPLLDGDGAFLPANRTTIQGKPFVWGGRPSDPMQRAEPDSSARAYMASLGMDHYIGGDAI